MARERWWHPMIEDNRTGKLWNIKLNPNGEKKKNEKKLDVAYIGNEGKAEMKIVRFRSVEEWISEENTSSILFEMSHVTSSENWIINCII